MFWRNGRLQEKEIKLFEKGEWKIKLLVSISIAFVAGGVPWLVIGWEIAVMMIISIYSLFYAFDITSVEINIS